MAKDKKDSITFIQTIDKTVYSDFYRKVKKEGLTVQEKVRSLISSYCNE